MAVARHDGDDERAAERGDAAGFPREDVRAVVGEDGVWGGEEMRPQ